jgi:lauroyl/myristoyl acyltransferase
MASKNGNAPPVSIVTMTRRATRPFPSSLLLLLLLLLFWLLPLLALRPCVSFLAATAVRGQEARTQGIWRPRESWI